MADKIDQLKIDNIAYDIDLPPDNPIAKAAIYSIVSGITTTAGNSSSGSYLSVKWTIDDVNGITEPYDGMKLCIRIPTTGVGTAGVLLSIDGGTTYHPVVYNNTTVLTSHYGVGTSKIFIYNASVKMPGYENSNTKTTYTGVWQGECDYDSNTTITYGTLAYYLRPYTAAALYRYKLCALNKDNRIVPIVTTNNTEAATNLAPTALAFKPDKIYFYTTTTTINAGAVISATTLMSVGYNNTNMAICNFNASVPAYRLIYLCGTYDPITNLFTLRDGGTAGSTAYYTFVPDNTANLTLSSYFTSGYDYILVGASYSLANYLQLFEGNPLYHFDGINLVPYDNWVTASLMARTVTYDATTSKFTGYIPGQPFKISPADLEVVTMTSLNLNSTVPIVFHSYGMSTTGLHYTSGPIGESQNYIIGFNLDTNGLIIQTFVKQIQNPYIVHINEASGYNTKKVISIGTGYSGNALTNEKRLKTVANASGDITTYYPYLKIDSSGGGDNWASHYTNTSYPTNGVTVVYESNGILIYRLNDSECQIGCCYCLTGDTLVTMVDGSQKRIDEIEIGEYILSYNWNTMELVPNKVIETDKDENKFHTEYDVWTFDDGTILKTVHPHEFFNVEKAKFEYMDKWNIGDHVYKQDGTMPALVSHETIQETIQHYKITGELGTNYFANGCLTGDRNNPTNIHFKED